MFQYCYFCFLVGITFFSVLKVVKHSYLFLTSFFIFLCYFVVLVENFVVVVFFSSVFDYHALGCVRFPEETKDVERVEIFY